MMYEYWMHIWVPPATCLASDRVLLRAARTLAAQAAGGSGDMIAGRVMLYELMFYRVGGLTLQKPDVAKMSLEFHWNFGHFRCRR